MQCPKCMMTRTRVEKTEHRPDGSGNVNLIRTRNCPVCHYRWATIEQQTGIVNIRVTARR